jgi:hypothetical protein
VAVPKKRKPSRTVTIRVSESDFDTLQLLRDHGWADARIFDLGIRAAACYQSGEFDVCLKELNEREKP